MPDEQRVPFGQTTGGIILIQGVVTAIVSAVVTWAINNGANLPWAWIAIVFIGIGVVLFLIMSLFSKRLRAAIWGWIPRFFKWIGGLRISTAGQRKAALSRATMSESVRSFASVTRPVMDDSEKELQKARVQAKQYMEERDATKDDAARTHLQLDQAFQQVRDLDTEAKALRKSLEASEALRAELVKVKRDREQLQANSIALQNQLGEMKAELNAKATPPLPAPDPRWEISVAFPEVDGDTTGFIVRNLMPGSIAYNVRIEVKPRAALHWVDAAFWPDMSGARSEKFEAHITDIGQRQGFTLLIEWLDENRDQQSLPFAIKPTIEPSPWNDTPF